MRKTLVVWGMFLSLYLVPEWSLVGILGKNNLKDGSLEYGEIVEMTQSTIQVKTSFHKGDPILIKWSEVAGIESEESLTFVLQNGMIVQGIPAMTQPGTLDVQFELLAEPIPVQIASVVTVNPPVKKAVVYIGNVNFGVSKVTEPPSCKIFFRRRIDCQKRAPAAAVVGDGICMGKTILNSWREMPLARSSWTSLSPNVFYEYRCSI